MIAYENINVSILDFVPAGYRQLQACLHESEKAYLFKYYMHELWIPKSRVIKCRGECWTPYDAIEQAKKFNETDGTDVKYEAPRDRIIRESANLAYLCHINPQPHTYHRLMTELADKLDELRQSELLAYADEKNSQGKVSACANVKAATQKVFG